MRWKAAFFLFALLAGPVLWASETTPPDKVEFNYPLPPKEGRADYFVVTEGGKARCCLVIAMSPKAEETTAALTLQTYLKLATGGDFALCRENNIPPGLGQIHVGETKKAQGASLDLPPARYGKVELPNVNGYLVKTLDPQTLVIRGATPAATVLGTVGLLRRYLGIRRYWPGEPGGLGDVVPKNQNLKLPEIEWRDWPYFISRTMSGLDDRGPRSKKTLSRGFASFWRMNYTIPSNESYYRLMKAREHANEPDLFPLINGKRFVPRFEPGKQDPHGWQPCVSNPRVAQIMTDSIQEFFRKNPDKFALNLAVNDGYGDCTCDKCRAMDAPGADLINRIGLCDRYVKFDNQVAEMAAKEFPDKILAFIAYGSMREPPTTVKLHPMLLPVLCVGRNAFQMWDDWARMGAKHMGVYFYHDDVWFIMPKMDIHQSAKRIRYVVAGNLARHFYQEFYGIYPLDGMVGYVEQELIWDPRQSEDDLLAEYYTRFYGKAAAPMKSFYEALEEGYTRWVTKVGEPHPHGPDLGSITDSKSAKQFSVLPVEIAVKAQGHLQEALAAAQGDAQAQERITLVKTLFDFAALGSRMYWAAERLKEMEFKGSADAQKALADAREAVDAGLALADYKFDVIEKPEINAYENHGDRDIFYNDLQKGSVHAEILNAIATAFGKMSAHVNWRELRQAEPRRALWPLMDAAAFDASGQKLVNVVPDPSFEERGAKRQPSTEPDAAGHLKRNGVNVWASAGTPVTCALTDEEAHTGKYSVVFQDTQRSGVSESIGVKDGDCMRMSVWLKHNDRKAKYIVETDPRAGAVHMPRSTIEVPWKPGEWQKFELLYIAQPGTKSVNLWVFVNSQSPGAKIWVDDFFIGKYPANQ